MRRMIASVLVLCVLAPVSARAGEAVAEAGTEASVAEPADESLGLGLDLEVGLFSAYLWRGVNVFQDSKQTDPHLLLAPALSYAFGDTGLSVGYWSAYQLNGDNRRELLDAGLGGEQDLFLAFEHAPLDWLTLSTGLTYYVYPFADAATAGVRVPQFLEPALGFAVSTAWADVSLGLGAFQALDAALTSVNHVYINPALSRGFELSAQVQLEVAAAYGFKIWTGGPDDDGTNVHDVLVTVALPVALSGIFSVTPSAGFVWTNLSGLGPADEVTGFGGLIVAAGL